MIAALFSTVGLFLLLFANLAHNNVAAKWAAVAGFFAWAAALTANLSDPDAWHWVAIFQALNAIACIWKAQSRYADEQSRREYERVMRP